MKKRPSMFLHADKLDVGMVMAVFVVLIGLVFFNILKLQSLHKAYAGEGPVYGSHSEKLQGIWGSIYDRDGELIGGNYFEMRVTASRLSLEKMGYEKFKKVASLLEIDDSAKSYKDLISGGTGNVELKVYPYQLFDYQKISSALRKWKMGSLLVFDPRSERYYPPKQFYSRFLSYASPERKFLKCGIEKTMDQYLSGSDGMRRYEHSRVVPLFEEKRAVDGDNVSLTIDSAVQFIVETELKRTVTQLRAKGGYVIVTRPRTGELLSFAGYFPARRPLDVLGVAAAYEPGSTIKPILASLALDKHIVTTRFETDCEHGSYRIGKRTIRDHSSFGVLSLPEIIWHSSNIGAVKLGQHFTDEQLYDGFRAFGLGEKTGIRLPGETSGYLLRPSRWGDQKKISMSFGYGLTVNVIQMTYALNAVVNGGVWMPPRLVEKVIGPDGQPVELKDMRKPRRVISELTSAKMRDILRGVVEFGTGTEAHIEGMDIGGKTGTARKTINGHYVRQYLASFYGFFPASDPEVSIFVLIDDPHGEYYGGKVAAPLFHTIGQKIIPLLIDEIGGVEVDVRQASMSTPDLPNTQAVVKGRVPSFKGLPFRDALILAHQAGYCVNYTGHGFVGGQRPAAGLVLPEGSLVTLKGVY